FQYFVDHGEPDLVEAVREGRKKEFESFQWEGEVPDPQSEKTYANSKLLWNFTEDVQKRIIFNYYQRLIKLRKEGYFAAFRDTDFNVQHLEQEKTISVYTAEGKRRIFACFNFSHHDQWLKLPAGKEGWSKIIASSDLQWAGSREL